MSHTHPPKFIPRHQLQLQGEARTFHSWLSGKKRQNTRKTVLSCHNQHWALEKSSHLPRRQHPAAKTPATRVSPPAPATTGTPTGLRPGCECPGKQRDKDTAPQDTVEEGAANGGAGKVANLPS